MSTLSLGLPEPLFGGPAPRLRAAPASVSFFDVLADAMVGALVREGDPFALADALVLVPNRRAARGLIDAFGRRLGGAALLPAIRPLGDPHADEDPDVWGADPAGLELAPPIDTLRRRLELAALIRRRDAAENGVEDPARALALADALARLLDSAAAVDAVAWEKLPTLVEEIELARHWAASAAFLQIITTYWPAHLKEQGLSDPAEHGAALRRALAAQWSAAPPQRPVVIAGSTGSQATTRELMRVVARLPRGVVVLPGVDNDLDEDSWRMVGDQHPQHALKETLKVLGVDRRTVPSLSQETPRGRARRLLLREALAPAEKTADWLARLSAAGGAAFVSAGAEGLRLLEAATEDEEATAIALMLRETLEQDGATAAVVTPDAGLARRIEAKLARWSVQPVVSHGTPMHETEAGRLIALICELSSDEADPVALAAFLKHPRVNLASDARALTFLEHKALRGARRFAMLGELAALDDLAEGERARELVAKVRRVLAPLSTLMQQREVTLAAFADAVAQACEAACGRGAWRDRDGEAAATLLREAIEQGRALGPVEAHAAPRVLLRLMSERELPPAPGGDARIAIWGVLEARLQRRDLMILAGLNEGVWPAAPGEDPFLSRSMRARIGLPSIDARIGLAAHDFAQLASAPNVVLTRALRREGAPTLASRWLWRLKTLMQGASAPLDRADQYLHWAHALHRPEAVTPVRAPCARPPAGKRLQRISVTSVETLIRDPYAVYAHRILGLEYLKPIGAPCGPAERGTAIHKAIERFGDGDDPNALMALLDQELLRKGVPPERRAAERERMVISVEALLDWFRRRRSPEIAIYREARGELDIDGVKLTGVADRIEIGPRGAVILDFKTGDPPSDEQVSSGLAPQLLLEAAMLARGAFPGLPKAEVDELVYWRLGNADPRPRTVEIEGGACQAGEAALASLRALLARYAQADQPFLSKPRVQFIKPYLEYDQLARRKEWADAEGEP